MNLVLCEGCSHGLNPRSLLVTKISEQSSTAKIDPDQGEDESSDKWRSFISAGCWDLVDY